MLPRRSLRGADDRRLVAQVRSGDEAASRNAFEVLFDRHHRGVLAFCRHMLGSLEEAEDAVQHTFSSAYRALLADGRDIALRAWLYAIARNRCLSMLAARREQVPLDDVEGVLPSTAGLASEVEQRHDLRELLADLQRLPPDQRAALVLAELEAHSHKEIADILGVPQAKVKALVFQARETLMIRRQARDTNCTEIREQLSVLRGGALRRRELRRHVEACEACQAFEAEVRRQRAGMALILPVVPTFALKNSTLASAFASTGTTAAAGVGAISSGGAVAGGIAVGTKAAAVKALAVLAVAGGAGGGGYVAVAELREPASKPAPGPAQVEGTSPPGAPAGTSPVLTTTTGTASGTATTPVEKRVSPATAVDGRERATERSEGKSGGTASAGRSERGTASSTKPKAVKKKKAVRATSKRRAAAERAAARAEAARRAAAERRARALEEAERKRRAAEAARQAREDAAATPPPATPPPPPPPPTTPTVTTPTSTAPTGPGRAR